MEDADVIQPGPIDPSVLTLQRSHRSQAIWSREAEDKLLRVRHRAVGIMKTWPLHDRIRPYVVRAGLYGPSRLCTLGLDHALITALVERWRRETHTFHLTAGEATITLQDVALLLGLRTDGPAVTGRGGAQHHVWADVVEELLGIRPKLEHLSGSGLLLTWLRDTFMDIPDKADERMLECYARAYCLALIGSMMLPDKSGKSIQVIVLPLLRDFDECGKLSWGSAVLANLYRELCRACEVGAREIGGCSLLIQLWAWERIPIGRPDLRLEAFHAPLDVPMGDPDDMPADAQGIREGTARQQDVTVPPNPNVSADVHGIGAAPAHQPHVAFPTDLDVPAADVQGIGAVPAHQKDVAVPQDPLGHRWRAPRTYARTPSYALVVYRDELDRMMYDQIIWQPYTTEQIALLPHIVADSHIWRARVPLIFFDVVEWHFADRVLRQFGLRQGIPEDCDTGSDLHNIDRRGKPETDWSMSHAAYITMWNDRQKYVIHGEMATEPMQHDDPYMTWYRRITRRFISPVSLHSDPSISYVPMGVRHNLLLDTLHRIYNSIESVRHGSEGDRPAVRQCFEDVHRLISAILPRVHARPPTEDMHSPSFQPHGRSRTQHHEPHRRGGTQHHGPRMRGGRQQHHGSVATSEDVPGPSSQTPAEDMAGSSSQPRRRVRPRTRGLRQQHGQHMWGGRQDYGLFSTASKSMESTIEFEKVGTGIGLHSHTTDLLVAVDNDAAI